MKSKGKAQSSYHLDRDISWMYFNQRILLEAAKDSVPLLDRLLFLGIYSNNLDEFFRVRVATLCRIIECEDKFVRKEKLASKAILNQIHKLNAAYDIQFDAIYERIVADLKAQNILLLNEHELSEEQQQFVYSFYQKNLNGATFPYYLSSLSQLSDLADSDIYFAVRLMRSKKEKAKSDKKEYALIEIPVKQFGRFVRLPDHEGKICLIFIDDLIRLCLPYIFMGMDYDQIEAFTFKFTKDAEMEMDNEVRSGVMEKVSKGIKSRKRGNPVRFIYDMAMPKELQKKIADKLGIDKNDTRIAGGRYQNLKDLMQFPDCGRSDLKYLPQPSLMRSDWSTGSVLQQIREKDTFLHYPYHSFSNYIRVLREAAISKEVKTIKTSLYRLAKESLVVKALICAAQNGKHVTVVIELMARFDEEANIRWSKQMQEAGIHVLFGVEGFKIHSKLLYIGSSKGNIACISTGNFHEGNARSYTDFTLFTAHPSVVREVNEVFDFIEKPYAPVSFKHLMVSPACLRQKLTSHINAEIKRARAGEPAYIMAALNHVTDKQLIKKLYEASEAGVEIQLLVRGNCSVMTGIKGISEHIHINGIIDRYLEHSRMIIFGNGGEERYYIGSADWMTRNLDHRIEVMAPVYDEEIRSYIKRVIVYGLCDTLQGRNVDGEGTNDVWQTVDNVPFRSQEALYVDHVNWQGKDIDSVS